MEQLVCYRDCVLLIAFSDIFHLELKQSMQRDQQGHQLKVLGIFACGGLEGCNINNPVFRANEDVLPMKAQRKSTIGFVNRHNGPANAV